MLPLNELSIETDPIFTLYRGYLLINYLIEKSEYKDQVYEYFKDAFNFEPKEYIYNILGIYIGSDFKNSDLNFIYPATKETKSTLRKLSIYYKNNETHKLLSIRKSPFIELHDDKYALIDSYFLLDKTYSQFLNDFWFDKIKKIKNIDNSLKYNIHNYRSCFGYFFKYYIKLILTKCFENYKYSKLLMFNELKIRNNNGNIELADIYLRYDNKIIIGQVKSGNIYDTEKYGGDMESLYKNNRNNFFNNFGINQLVKSILNIDKHINMLDATYSKSKNKTIYPCIFVNDNSLQTPLMADAFNKRFLELIDNVKISKINIKSLTIIHINDLETLEETLNKNPKKIWDLLKTNQINKNFIPPFYYAIKKMNITKEYPDRIIDLYNSLVLTYNPRSAEAAPQPNLSCRL